MNHNLYAELVAAIEVDGALAETTLRLRKDVAVASAEAGEVESAYYQFDELERDALREYGPDAQVTKDIQAAKAQHLPFAQ